MQPGIDTFAPQVWRRDLHDVNLGLITQRIYKTNEMLFAYEEYKDGAVSQVVQLDEETPIPLGFDKVNVRAIDPALTERMELSLAGSQAATA